MHHRYFALERKVRRPVGRGRADWDRGHLHAFQPVHRTEIQSVGGRYWAYYCNPYGTGIGLATSDNLLTWQKDPEPVLGTGSNDSETVFRWPSVTHQDGLFHMFVSNYPPRAAHDSFIKRYVSPDGRHFECAETVYRPAQIKEFGNPFIWVNPNDHNYYLFFAESHHDQARAADITSIRCKIGTSVTSLARAPTSDLGIAWRNVGPDRPTARIYDFSPSVLYDPRTKLYWLLTEERPRADYYWITRSYYSSCPLSGFVEACNSPILVDNEACAMHFLSNRAVHVYYCHFVGPQEPLDWEVRVRRGC